MNLNTILEKLDYYFIFAPTNSAEEKERFFNALEKGEIYNPNFIYKKISTVELKKIVTQLNQQKASDQIEKAFIKLYLDVAQMIIAWTKDDYQTITNLSGKVFGNYTELNVENAITFYKQLRPKIKKSTKTHTARELGDAILNELSKLGAKGWKIIYDDNNPSEASIYEDRKEVMLKTNHLYADESYKRIICHEIYAHGFQAFNARLQEKYKQYLLSYLGTEKQYEGIAIFIEINTLPSSFFNAIFARYVAFMLANYYAVNGSFYQTYQQIYALTNNQEFSYMAAFRAKRGFRDTSKKGSFQKENAYLYGVYQTIKIIAENQDNFYKLMQGNFPFDLLPLLDKSETKWLPIKKLKMKNIKSFEQKLAPLFNL